MERLESESCPTKSDRVSAIEPVPHWLSEKLITNQIKAMPIKCAFSPYLFPEYMLISILHDVLMFTFSFPRHKIKSIMHESN